jgi:hypothetical protein
MTWRQAPKPACSVTSWNTVGPESTKPPAVMGRRCESYTAENVPPVALPPELVGLSPCTGVGTCVEAVWASGRRGVVSATIKPLAIA